MSQNGHEERSCAKRSSAAYAARWPRVAWSICVGQRRPSGRPQQPSLPFLLHFSTPKSRTIPNLKIRSVCPTDKRDGNRQYMRISGEVALLRGGMGKKYSVLPRPTSDRPSSAFKASVVGVIRSQRVPVFHAPPCSSFIGGCRTPRVADGGGPSSRLHGPHTNLPRASGEAESPPRRLSGILLSEGHRPLHDRCMWPVRRNAHRKSTRKIPVCSRRILQKSIPKPAHPLRKATPPVTVTKNRQLASHRTTILCPASREDAYRDPHQRHAVIRQFVLVAVHGDYVTHDVATAGGGMIHALRLPAVPAEPAVRPLPEVPT